MAEYGVPFSLVTPAGTITFNSYNATNGYIRLSSVSGLDSPAIRATVDSKPQRDGALVSDAFLGARSVVLEGHIIPGSDGLGTRVVLADALAAALLSIRRADGTLKWTPTGGSGRQMTVRLLDGLATTAEDSILKKFQVALIAGDPLIYGQTVNTRSVIHDVALTDSNAGNITTYPSFNINGPITDPVLTNTTTGEVLDFTANGGLVISSASVHLFVEMAQEAATISVFDGSWLKTQYVDISVSTWWGLRPGSNSVVLTGSGTSGASTLEMVWRDAYA